ncbi:MAG TPA: DUF3267 domain-containing protein [Dysgonamonadaceae bacterium]|nr:DUF3267 domain-containing protein [Dysgonamonadaceae bacterium]
MLKKINNTMHPDNQQNKYTKKPITFTIEQAAKLYIRLMGALIITLVVPFIIIYFQSFRFYFYNFSWMTLSTDIFLFIIVIIIGIVLHEAIHGLTWALFVKERLRAIKFGILKEYLTPYCHCKGYLRVKHYIAGAIMPAILLGILPTLWAFVNGKIMFFFLGIYFIVAASGDFLIIYLLRNEHRNDYVKDHESLPGCIVYKFKE